MLAQLKFFKHVWVLIEIVGMVSFELDEELRRMFFRLVTSQIRPAYCVSYELRNRPRSPKSLCGLVVEHRSANPKV